MRVRRFFTLLMLMAALALRPAAANDTETGFTAGQPYPVKSATLRLLCPRNRTPPPRTPAYPVKSATLRLLSENLQVELAPRSAEVEVTFVLRNEGPARDVVLGFPYFTHDDLKYQDMPYAGDLQAFECKVDGQPVTLSPSRGTSINSNFKSTSWYTWTVHFDAGQTHRVWHRYRGALGSSTAGQTPDGKEALVVTFDYILTTARNWKAPIGDFHLTIRAKEPLALSDVYAASIPMKDEGGVLLGQASQGQGRGTLASP